MGYPMDIYSAKYIVQKPLYPMGDPDHSRQLYSVDLQQMDSRLGLAVRPHVGPRDSGTKEPTSDAHSREGGRNPLSGGPGPIPHIDPQTTAGNYILWTHKLFSSYGGASRT